MKKSAKHKASVGLKRSDFNGQLDELMNFYEFWQTAPETVRAQVRAGQSADEILRAHSALAAARIVAIAATAENVTTALSASKDVIDRAQGRATEKKEITHKYENMTDEELNSLLLSHGEDLKDLTSQTDKSEKH